MICKKCFLSDSLCSCRNNTLELDLGGLSRKVDSHMEPLYSKRMWEDVWREEKILTPSLEVRLRTDQQQIRRDFCGQIIGVGPAPFNGGPGSGGFGGGGFGGPGPFGP